MRIPNRLKKEDIKQSKIGFWKSIRGFGFPDYDAYLKTSHWKQKKKEYAASGRLKECVVCGDYKYILHHLTYERLGNERLDDFIPVCSNHHSEIHKQVNERTLRLESGSLWVAADLMGTGFASYKEREKYVRELVRLNIVYAQRAEFNSSRAGVYHFGSKAKVKNYKKEREKIHGSDPNRINRQGV